MLDTDGARSQWTIWNDLVGGAWVRHAALHDRQAEPFGLAAMDRLGDLRGARTLDVGCGTGASALQLHERGAAEVLGVDLSVPMIEAARNLSRPDVRFEAGDVLELDRPGSFDVVFSRFGVMFFPDPTAAFGRLRALGSDGARLAFCCWGPPSSNPIMTLPVLATIPVLGPPQFAGPGEPGPFSLASPDAIQAILGAAGWADVKVIEMTAEPPHAGDAATVADVVMDFNPLIVEGLRRQPALRPEARKAIIEAVRPFEREGIVHLGANALIVTARAPMS
jgi:SAM-dependent methyltransferase